MYNSSGHFQFSLNSNQPASDENYKIILVGESNVGKTTLYNKLVGLEISNKNITTLRQLEESKDFLNVVDFAFKTINYQNKKITYQIWDTGGQEKYESLSSQYFKGTDIVLLVFDLNDPSTFEKIIQKWYSVSQENTKGAIMILVGNKKDLQIKISKSKTKAFFKDLKYFEISALHDQNVDQLFIEMVELIRNSVLPIMEGMVDKSQPQIRESSASNYNNQRQSDKCC